MLAYKGTVNPLAQPLNNTHTAKGFLTPHCSVSFQPSLLSLFSNNLSSAFCHYRSVCIFYSFTWTDFLVWLLYHNVIVLNLSILCYIAAHSYSFLSSVPRDINLFLHLLMKTLTVSTFLLLHMKYLWSFMYILIALDVSGCIHTDVK